DVVLKFDSARVDGNRLEVVLRDVGADAKAASALRVTLVYEVFPGSAVLRRQASVENTGSAAITVENLQAGAVEVPPNRDYRLTYTAGRWAGEWQLQHETLAQGKKVLESREGTTSHRLNPWFALDTGSASETTGEVWFGALGWSGNWKLTAERVHDGRTRVTAGYNDFDFSWPLKPGEKFVSPWLYLGYTAHGFGEMSRAMHRFERDNLLPGGATKLRPVLYNSWEATTFDVTEAGQKTLASKAAKLGVELYVIDDGWFGVRNTDHAGLGDWFVNPKKFPDGLKPLIDHVHGLGMKFGFWVEPEMVNPDSDLYRAHPDWAMHFPGRPRTEARNQLVLNMAREDVKEHIYGVLDKLLRDNAIDFVKWDMNRPFGEPGWPNVPESEQRKIWIKYVRNVYEIADRLRAAHPGVEFEGCSGGGGRIDLELMRRVEEFWTSDNTDAYDRLRIQEGFSYMYAPKAMMAWVTDVPNLNGRSTPLRYRFLVAMQGSLGIGGDLNKWSEADLTYASKMVEVYRWIRKSVQEGALYRLASPSEGGLSSTLYVAQDKRQACLFAFRDHQQFLRQLPALRLQGLDAGARYRLRVIEGQFDSGTGTVLSGDYLMHHGLKPDLRGDYDAALVVLAPAP
ncbi:MAG: alpha-galactosidase, partial [Bryobacteraceae bacterium]